MRSGVDLLLGDRARGVQIVDDRNRRPGRQRRLRPAQVPGDELAQQMGAVPFADHGTEVFPVQVGDADDAVRGVAFLRSADHALSVRAAYAPCPSRGLSVHMHDATVVHMHTDGSPSTSARPTPSRRTEIRHTANGATCHHFQRYGITCDEYDELQARAAGRCEICNREENEVPGETLFIDHVHDTNPLIIRGLVCARCNSVMACHDGAKKWGPSSLALAAEARAYHLRAMNLAALPGGEN